MTSRYHIVGPTGPLAGHVELAGSKNAALPMMVAKAAAHDSRNQLTNVPFGMRDIDDMSVLLDTDQPWLVTEANAERASRLRSSLILLGLGLYRAGRADIPRPGGCAIGRRPYDIHLRGFESLGAHCTERDGRIQVEATELVGADITFVLPSTTATQNVVLAACGARGRTVIRNANTRPENRVFFDMLRGLGADIVVEPRLVVVNGPTSLSQAGRFVVPSGGDEAVTWLIAGAMTGGSVSVGPIHGSDIEAELNALRAVGIQVEQSGSTITATGRPTGTLEITTGPPPEVGSDMQPLFGALATRTDSTATITDRRFTERFQYLDALTRFGVICRSRGNTASIDGRGQRALEPAVVEGTDLRGAMAAVLVALCADGESVVGGCQHLERGYIDAVATLNQLGGQVTRLL